MPIDTAASATESPTIAVDADALSDALPSARLDWITDPEDRVPRQTGSFAAELTRYFDDHGLGERLPYGFAEAMQDRMSLPQATSLARLLAIQLDREAVVAGAIVDDVIDAKEYDALAQLQGEAILVMDGLVLAFDSDVPTQSSQSPALVHECGLIYIDLDEDDDTIDCPEGFLFFFDAGGDDIHYHNAGGACGGAAMAIELGGDDDYLGGVWSPETDDGSATDGRNLGINLPDTCVAGGAISGAGLLLDVGGNDLYQSSARAQTGGSHKGVGTLIDLEGNDQYRALGGSMFNHWHVDCERRLGAYSYYYNGGYSYYYYWYQYCTWTPHTHDERTPISSTGGVTEAGIGILSDGQGEDRYFTDNALDYRSASTGSFAGYEGAGIGYLVDATGDDQYLLRGGYCERFCGAFHGSSALLAAENRHGREKDSCGIQEDQICLLSCEVCTEATLGGQLYDLQGDDRYQACVNAADASRLDHGAARNGDYGILFDGDGRDVYREGRSDGNCDRSRWDALILAKPAADPLRGEVAGHGVQIDRQGLDRGASRGVVTGAPTNVGQGPGEVCTPNTVGESECTHRGDMTSKMLVRCVRAGGSMSEVNLEHDECQDLDNGEGAASGVVPFDEDLDDYAPYADGADLYWVRDGQLWRQNLFTQEVGPLLPDVEVEPDYAVVRGMLLEDGIWDIQTGHHLVYSSDFQRTDGEVATFASGSALDLASFAHSGSRSSVFYGHYDFDQYGDRIFDRTTGETVFQFCAYYHQSCRQSGEDSCRTGDFGWRGSMDIHEDLLVYISEANDNCVNEDSFLRWQGDIVFVVDLSAPSPRPYPIGRASPGSTVDVHGNLVAWSRMATPGLMEDEQTMHAGGDYNGHSYHDMPADKAHFEVVARDVSAIRYAGTSTSVCAMASECGVPDIGLGGTFCMLRYFYWSYEGGYYYPRWQCYGYWDDDDVCVIASGYGWPPSQQSKDSCVGIGWDGGHLAGCPEGTYGCGTRTDEVMEDLYVLQGLGPVIHVSHPVSTDRDADGFAGQVGTANTHAIEPMVSDNLIAWQECEDQGDVKAYDTAHRAWYSGYAVECGPGQQSDVLYARLLSTEAVDVPQDSGLQDCYQRSSARDTANGGHAAVVGAPDLDMDGFGDCWAAQYAHLIGEVLADVNDLDCDSLGNLEEFRWRLHPIYNLPPEMCHLLGPDQGFGGLVLIENGRDFDQDYLIDGHEVNYITSRRGDARENTAYTAGWTMEAIAGGGGDVRRSAEGSAGGISLYAENHDADTDGDGIRDLEDRHSDNVVSEENNMADTIQDGIEVWIFNSLPDRGDSDCLGDLVCRTAQEMALDDDMAAALPASYGQLDVPTGDGLSDSKEAYHWLVEQGFDTILIDEFKQGVSPCTGAQTAREIDCYEEDAVDNALLDPDTDGDGVTDLEECLANPAYRSCNDATFDPLVGPQRREQGPGGRVEGGIRGAVTLASIKAQLIHDYAGQSWLGTSGTASSQSNIGLFTCLDPAAFDSDGDGFGDGYEIHNGTDPCTPGGSPVGQALPVGKSGVRL